MQIIEDISKTDSRDFISCEFGLQRFDEMDLSQFRFENCIFHDCSFRGALLEDCTFLKCKTIKADFSFSRLSDARFSA